MYFYCREERAVIWGCIKKSKARAQERGDMEQTLWGHLPLLVRSNSKESVEYILQALWRTRKTGLDAADRHVIRDILQLQNDSDLDPLLVCLRTLIRRCVYENISKDEIQKLFPSEVLPELQRLLTLLLQKFQKEWREEVLKDQVVLPRLKAMTWDMGNHESTEVADPVAVINLKLQNDAKSQPGESDVKFRLAKDTLDTMLRSMYCIRDQLSNMDETSNVHSPQETNTV
ncbi:hypothetical protein Patl1_18275 [Pistacia atlantica]|uniref:Uncharacterized protein n=1 Tax=Pistacia atlantica TaxID=434234 RepID=A0ACC1BZH5_9ROSI|nr:hypothetical protein Patl1_18275 [Pistacia atlantica]